MARPVDGASNAREQASRAARRMRIKVDHRGARARKAADDVPDTQRVPDPFENLTSDGQLLAPPYNPRDLAIIGEGSTILRQCVDAYKINIHGHGIRYRTRFDPAKETEQARIDRAADEEELLKDFLESCNPEMSFRQMRQNTGEDKENVGYSGIEILRSSADGRPVGLEPLPGYLLRLGKQDTTATQVFRWRYDATQRRWEKKYFMRRLRVYATHNGVEVRYLKSYGDPRSIDSKTGRPVAGSDLEKFLKAGGELAHELLFFRVYSSRTAYGIPRWVGCSLGMAGSRAQENQNLGSLENNAIPPYALLTNAELDPATLAFLEEKFDEAADPERAHRPIIIQALPADASEDATFMDGRAPATKMELVRLSRPDEGMYLTYDEANRRKVQQSFRPAGHPRREERAHVRDGGRCASDGRVSDLCPGAGRVRLGDQPVPAAGVRLHRVSGRVDGPDGDGRGRRGDDHDRGGCGRRRQPERLDGGGGACAWLPDSEAR
jgi:capsid portal protein